MGHQPSWHVISMTQLLQSKEGPGYCTGAASSFPAPKSDAPQCTSHLPRGAVLMRSFLLGRLNVPPDRKFNFVCIEAWLGLAEVEKSSFNNEFTEDLSCQEFSR
jgi:hypothetical protein